MKICGRAAMFIPNVFSFATCQHAAQNEREAENDFWVHDLLLAEALPQEIK